MKTQYFSGAEYHTDIHKMRKKGLNPFTGTRFWFIRKFMGIVFRSRKLAIEGIYDVNEWTRSSIDIMRLLEKSGAVFHITGLDKLRTLNEPVVFISNHMSTLETMVFPGLIAPFVDVTFVVKDSLVSMPLFGHIMKSRDPIVVSRSNSREDLLKVINEGCHKLEERTSVIIFPQSTRREFFDPDEFNSLGVKLALRSKRRIVPVAIRTDFWKNGKLIKDLGPFNKSIPINIKFGDLIEVQGNGKEQHQQILSFVLENLNLWGANIVDKNS